MNSFLIRCCACQRRRTTTNKQTNKRLKQMAFLSCNSVGKLGPLRQAQIQVSWQLGGNSTIVQHTVWIHQCSRWEHAYPSSYKSLSPINVFVIEAHDSILIIQGLHVLLQRDNQPAYVCTNCARKAFGAHTRDFHSIICWHTYHLITIKKSCRKVNLWLY